MKWIACAGACTPHLPEVSLHYGVVVKCFASGQCGPGTIPGRFRSWSRHLQSSKAIQCSNLCESEAKEGWIDGEKSRETVSLRKHLFYYPRLELRAPIRPTGRDTTVPGIMTIYKCRLCKVAHLKNLKYYVGGLR